MVRVCVEVGGVVGRERRLVEGTSGEKDGERERTKKASTVISFPPMSDTVVPSGDGVNALF